MKLFYRILLRFSLILSVLFVIWAALFYFAIMDEVNDEVDDALEDYSEQIITRSLAGDSLPNEDNGSNNQFYLEEITNEQARNIPHIRYLDSMVYIKQKKETEPARILITIFKDNKEKYHKLTVSVPTIEKKDLAEAILYWVVILFVILLVINILVHWATYYKNMRPLYVLLKWLDNYKVGGKNIPLRNETGIPEFKKLNIAIQNNMKRAEQLFEEQKIFIGNASHELQTPLAVCLNRLEMVLEDDTLSEKQMDGLMKTHQSLTYVSKLNKSLLLLSKIENKQFGDNVEVSFNRKINEILPNLKEVYEHMNINVHIEERAEFSLLMNDVLSNLLISNILNNSFSHNIKDGAINILIVPNSICITNTGLLKCADSKRIFERFYHESTKEGSSGLGLAIVKSICDFYSLSVSYHYKDGMHSFLIEK